MDISKLNYFFAAADLGNFTKAAEKCDIAQTTMSKYVRTLEDELGFMVFSRTNKGCELTEKGRLFYDGIKKIYMQYEELLVSIENSGRKQLWIGIEGEIHNIPEFTLFEDQHPEIKLSIIFGQKGELIESLRVKRTDALLFLNLTNDFKVSNMRLGTVNIPGQEEQFICSDKLLEEYGSVKEVIRNVPMITKNNDQKYHDFADHMLMRKFGVLPAEKIYIDAISKQMLMVRLSQGFAIAPVDEIPNLDGLTVTPLDEMFVIAYTLLYDKDNVSDELRKLIDFTKKRFEDQ